MHHRILSQLREVNRDLPQLLDRETVLRVCREAGHRWRMRTLDPATTLLLFIRQVLHGNTACQHVTHFGDEPFTASAYCQARQRLPQAVFRGVLDAVTAAARSGDEGDGRWHGHRTFLVDGSSFSMPDSPALQGHFGQHPMQKAGCGFPIAHVLALVDLGTGLLLAALALPWRVHEMSHVARVHPEMAAGDLLLGDRAFCSYAHLALLLRRGLHAVFRAHSTLRVDFTPHRAHIRHGHHQGAVRRPYSQWLRRLGDEDQVVRWYRPPEVPAWMTQAEYDALPESIDVRELRYRAARSGFRTRQITLVTTLLDGDAYTAAEMADLYRRRWEVETHLRELKTTMGMEVLHCRDAAGIEKELAVFALVYNLVRMTMCEAARRQGMAVSRLSFIDALRWLRSDGGDNRLITIAANPSRGDRCEPRAIKRRPKPFPWLTRPREEERKRLRQGELAQS